MKYKSIAAIAVLAMFLASSFCAITIFDSNGDNPIVYDNVEPLKIDNTGVTHGDPKLFNAEYDKDTHTLTFKDEVSVINFTCDISYPYMIDVNLDDFTIIVNGTTLLKSNEVGDTDAGAIRLTKVNETIYDDNGILTIKGDGTLTLKPAYPTAEKGKSCNVIRAIFINVIRCTLNIDGSDVPDHFRGIYAQVEPDVPSSYISIINSTVNIVGNGDKHIVDRVNIGLYCNRIITIQNSVVNINKTVEGIFGETSRLSKVAEGHCTILNSDVTINGFDGEDKSSSIGMNTLNVNSTTLVATAGNVTGTGKNAVNINVTSLNINDSDVTLTTKKGNHCSCIEFGMATLVKNSRLHCESSVGNDGDVSSDFDACIKTSSKSLFSAYDSEIIVNNNRIGQRDNVYGIFTNCIFVNSTFSVSAGENKAFAKGVNYEGIVFEFTVSIDTGSITALQGSMDGVHWRDLTDTGKIFAYDAIRGYKIETAVFDLNGGDGSTIPPITNLKTGDEITLPECDATKDGQVFAGWNDGKNVYQPGDKYVIEEDMVFYAQYADAPVEPKSDNSGIIIAVVGVVMILAIIGIGALIFSTKR